MGIVMVVANERVFAFCGRRRTRRGHGGVTATDRRVELARRVAISSLASSVADAATTPHCDFLWSRRLRRSARGAS